MFHTFIAVIEATECRQVGDVRRHPGSRHKRRALCGCHGPSRRRELERASPPCVLVKEGDVYLVVVIGFLFSAGGIVLFVVAFLLGRWSVKAPASTKRLVRDDRNLL